jgi:hypothetical protein
LYRRPSVLLTGLWWLSWLTRAGFRGCCKLPPDSDGCCLSHPLLLLCLLPERAWEPALACLLLLLVHAAGSDTDGSASIR